VGYDRLNAQDAALLCAQDPATPLQIGAVALVDLAPLLTDGGGVDLVRLRRHVEGRLGRLPRFRQKLLPVAFEQGPPVWVDDPDFDIVDHVSTATLPQPGGERELRAFVVRLLEQPLDDQRPLWELWLVEGLVRPDTAITPQQAALILKASHVMADGIALLGFAWAMLDTDPHDCPDETVDAPATGAVDHAGPGASPPRPGRLWIETAFARARHDVAVLARTAAAGVQHPTQTVRQTTTLVRGLSATLVPAPALAITRPVGTSRDFSWLRLSLDDMRTVAATFDVSLNDVMLSIVAAGLEEYQHPRRRPSPRGARVLVPVSTHEADDLAGLGNNFAMMIAELPEDGLDPVERLQAVHRSTATCKASGQTSLAPVLFGASELVPVWLLRRIAPTLIRHQPFANLAVTNMSGSSDPLYLLGARMRELYPFITVTGNIGVIIGVLSYVDELGLSVTVDADVVPELDRLIAAMAGAADALVDQAGRQP